MRKIIFLTILFVILSFSLSGCRGRDLTDYHMVNEKWEEKYDDVVYSFEYIECTSNSVTINIKRENDFYCEDIIDGSTRLEDKMYMFASKTLTKGNFDYVKVDGIKVEEKYYLNLVAQFCYYEIGSNNEACVVIYTSDKRFKGYVKSSIDTGQIESCWNYQIIQFTLY